MCQGQATLHTLCGHVGNMKWERCQYCKDRLLKTPGSCGTSELLEPLPKESRCTRCSKEYEEGVPQFVVDPYLPALMTEAGPATGSFQAPYQQPRFQQQVYEPPAPQPQSALPGPARQRDEQNTRSGPSGPLAVPQERRYSPAPAKEPTKAHNQHSRSDPMPDESLIYYEYRLLHVLNLPKDRVGELTADYVNDLKRGRERAERERRKDEGGERRG